MKLGRKFKNTLIATAALMLATAGMASAEHIEGVYVKYGTPNTVEISGKYFDDADGEYATIFILKPGFRGAVADISDFDADDIEKQKQVKIENGEFSLSFELNTLKTGKYATYIKAGNTDVKYTFVQTNLTEATNYFNNVIGASETDFQSTLESKSWLNLADTAYNEVDAAAVCKMVYAIKDDITDVNDLRVKVLAASYVQALNEGKAELVLDDMRFVDAKSLGLDTLSTDPEMLSNAYEIFLGIYDEDGKAVNVISDTGKKELIKKLQNNSYASVDEFLKDFVGKVTIAAIRYNKNTDQTSSIIQSNNKVNGFDLSVYKKDSKGVIDSELINSTTWDIDDIKEIVEETDISGSGSGSSGSGSSVTTSTIGGASGGYSQDYTIGGLETPEVTEGTFTDLADVKWAKDYIEGLAAAGVVSGRGDGIYAPLDNVTRAEFLMMLVKALGIDTTGATCDFPDVIAGEWYYEAVAAGTSFGLASGYGDGNFGTTDLITRQDAAVMLNNAITKSGKTLDEINESIDFADKADISDYAADDVDVLVKAGILSGSNGSFMPKSNTTRAEAAVMISKIMTAIGLEG